MPVGFCFSESFYHENVLNFVTSFFCINWYHHVTFGFVCYYGKVCFITKDMVILVYVPWILEANVHSLLLNGLLYKCQLDSAGWGCSFTSLLNFNTLVFYLFWPHWMALRDLSTQPVIEAGPQQWKSRILSTRPLGNYQHPSLNNW